MAKDMGVFFMRISPRLSFVPAPFIKNTVLH